MQKTSEIYEYIKLSLYVFLIFRKPAFCDISASAVSSHKILGCVQFLFSLTKN